MKALIIDNKGGLTIGEAPKPTINEFQALVKVMACGICNGTDTKLIRGKFKGFTYENDYPLVLGHESVGRVVEIGAKVSSYKVGDIVMIPYGSPSEGLNSAWGAYAEYAVVHDAKALSNAGVAIGSESFPECAFGQNIVPTDIDPIDAVMIITLREVLSAIKTFGINANDSVAIFGCGPVGVTFIRFMSLLGIHPIIAFDIEDSKLDKALENGATYAYNSKKIDVTKCVRELCPNGVDFVIDAVGVNEIINQGFKIIRDRGSICCYGISSTSSMELDWTAAPYNWNICFQQMPSKIEEGEVHAQVLSWLRTGVIKLTDYISDYVEFEDVIDAFERLDRGEIKLKCVVKF